MTHRLTRRQVLGLSAGGVFTAAWPGALRAQDAGRGGEFTFIAVNDTHWIDAQCNDFLTRVWAQMKASTPRPDFCLLAGDLTEHGTPAALAAMRALVNDPAFPAYVVIGNHDYVSPTDRTPYETHFPDRLNYHFEHKGWQFLGLDTSEGQKYNNTTVQPHTLQWLETQVPRLDRHKPTVIFTHFPLGPLTPSRPLNADAVLERCLQLNLQAVFTGHFHGFTERAVRNASLTTNRCCALKRNNHDGTREKGYFLCRAKEGKIMRTFVEVPAA